jgi:hypothetical protein
MVLRDEAIARALATLSTVSAAEGLADLALHTRIVVSPLWAGVGGSAIFRRVNLPPRALDLPIWQLASLLAHELVHVRQGIRFFGSIDTEREAFLVQRRVELELLGRQNPLPLDEIWHRQNDLKVLERSFESAKAWIVSQGPSYARFPDEQPRWWQVSRWWPQVAYALRTAWDTQRRGGGAAHVDRVRLRPRV